MKPHPADVEVTVGADPDVVDEAPSDGQTEGRGISSATDSITLLKRKFLSDSVAEEKHEVQTCTASTMTSFRYACWCYVSLNVNYESD